YGSIAHLKFRSQPGFILAFNPCMLAVDSVRADLGLVRMAAALAQNAAHPGGVLEYPHMVNEEMATRIRDSWNLVNSADNVGQTAILEEGLKYTPLKVPSAADQQMVEALEWSAADLA